MYKFYRTVENIRAEVNENKDELVVTGYAVLTDSESNDLGGFKEVITKGALTEEVVSKDLKLLFDHDVSKVLGRVKAGTLTWEIDSRGLKFTAKLPNSPIGLNVFEWVKRGDVDQCSFGFFADLEKEGYTNSYHNENGELVVEILKIDEIFEVSIVTYPAYEDTNVDVIKRSLNKHLNKDYEKETIELKNLIDEINSLFKDN